MLLYQDPTNEGPKVFPEELAWSAARRRRQKELVLLRQRGAEVDCEVGEDRRPTCRGHRGPLA